MAILLLPSTFILLFSSTTCVREECHVLQQGSNFVSSIHECIYFNFQWLLERDISLIYNIDKASFPDQSSCFLLFQDGSGVFFPMLVNHAFLMCFSP